MTDYVAHFLPVIPGYVNNRYRWLRDRGCHFDVEDLIQIATIELIKLSRTWTGVVDGREIPPGEASEKMFFALLKLKVQTAIREYREDIEPDGKTPDSFDRTSDDGLDSLAELRTAVKVKDSTVVGKIVLDDITDYFSILPRRDKLMLALRYFDELTYREIGSLFDRPENSVAAHVSKVLPLIRDFARNQFTEHVVDVPHRRDANFDPSDALIEYVRARHRTDIAGYLGYVTTCFRNDVGYFTDMLGPGHNFTPRSKRSVIRHELADEIDRRLAAGERQIDIAAALNVARTTVWNHAHRRAVV